MQDKLKLPNNLFFSEVEQWLAAERSVELPAKGRSMWPFVVEGRDKIVLRRPATVRMGDIVLAHMEQSRYVLHRVYRLEKDAITLMGDGNCYVQEHCRLSDICGVATEIVRKRQRVDCRSRREQRLWRLWKQLLPVRKWLLRIYRLYLQTHKRKCI